MCKFLGRGNGQTKRKIACFGKITKKRKTKKDVAQTRGCSLPELRSSRRGNLPVSKKGGVKNA